MPAKIDRFIERHHLLDGASGVVVAVSGGADSVALLDVLVRLVSRDQLLTPNPHLHVAHLDHKLRGPESTEDAEFVRALADRLGLPVEMKSVDVRAAAEAAARGIEEVAREIRYQFLVDVANQTGCNRIAVGHTMTDQAETFLMRLIRGSGLRGLAAMRPVVPAHVFEKQQRSGGAEERRSGGAEEQRSPSGPLRLCSSAPLPLRSSAPLLIRPLLCVTREEVEDYCRKRGLEFRTDSSNRSLDYNRNRVRHEVLPTLKGINPRVVEAIARATETIGGDEDLLDHLATALLEKARTTSGVQNSITYSVAALLDQRPEMRRRTIIAAIRSARASNLGSEPNEITSIHVSAVESLLDSRASGKHITLPGMLEVWREFDTLVLKRRQRAPHDGDYESLISSSRASAQAGGFNFTLERGLDGDLLKGIIEETKLETQRAGRDWMIVALDNLALPKGLLIRPRRAGESAHVIGQRRAKKLKSLMIDHRIPAGRRADWPLVMTPDGHYVWSPGLPPALEFAASTQTKRLAVLRASELSN
ncbi:MAG TPA: tRNA lysidine(34) synthetase TilS [Blastocatellia bacterium]|nr:tRNA lysidine(34) synthetase TilS [Blastocatellia bacterium]